MINVPYTEMQLKIIKGEIPMETLDGRALVWLYKKAVANGDVELAERVLKQKDQSKDKAKKRNTERTVKNIALRRKGIYQWKPAKSNKYTEHHKLIIRGEIPFYKVHTNELIAIHQKALCNEDYVLAELILDQIDYRRQTERLRDKKYKRRKNNLAAFANYDENSQLSLWEQSILNGDINFEDYSHGEISKLIEKLTEIKDEDNLKIALQLLSYKQDISILYPTKDHWIAIDALEELLQLPIRRPKDWF